MPKKRTKSQKIHAKHQSVVLPSNTFTDNQHKPKSADLPKASSIESLYAYDPIYLFRDLRRTLIISGLILALQIGLYMWLK